MKKQILIAVTAVGYNFLVGYRAQRTDWLVLLIMPDAVSLSLFLLPDLDSPRGGAIRATEQPDRPVAIVGSGVK